MICLDFAQQKGMTCFILYKANNDATALFLSMNCALNLHRPLGCLCAYCIDVRVSACVATKIWHGSSKLARRCSYLAIIAIISHDFTSDNSNFN